MLYRQQIFYQKAIVSTSSSKINIMCVLSHLSVKDLECLFSSTLKHYGTSCEEEWKQWTSSKKMHECNNAIHDYIEKSSLKKTVKRNSLPNFDSKL